MAPLSPPYHVTSALSYDGPTLTPRLSSVARPVTIVP